MDTKLVAVRMLAQFTSDMLSNGFTREDVAHACKIAHKSLSGDPRAPNFVNVVDRVVAEAHTGEIDPDLVGDLTDMLKNMGVGVCGCPRCRAARYAQHQNERSS